MIFKCLRHLIAAAALFSGLASTHVRAQNAPAADVQPQQGMDQAAPLFVFLPEDFAAYSPVTARDAINRLPGIEIVDGGDQRGLGTGGNVLINGERAGGKSNSALDQLRRLSAGTIVRIEVYAAGTSAFDAGGASQVINVVLDQKSGAISGTYGGRILYRPRLGIFHGDIFGSASWTKGALTVDLAFESDASKTGTIADETLSLEGEDRADVERFEDRLFQFRDYEFTGGLAWKISPDRVFRLTAIGQFSDESTRELTDDFVSLDGPLETTQFAFSAEGVEAEVTAEYEQRLTKDLQLKFTALGSIDISNNQSANVLRDLSDAGSITQVGNEFEEAEAVLRARSVWSLSPGHTLTTQLEAAYNTLDASLYSLTLPLDTPLVEVRAQENIQSITNVAEYRSDGFVEHQWALSPKLTLTNRLAGEISRISVSGSSESTRTLIFPKPQVELSYQVTPKNRLRFFVQRAVGQLNFFNFTANVSLLDNEERGSTGSLRPQREWLSSVTWEMQLPRSSGRTSVRLYYDVLQDVISSAPVSDDPLETVEAISNIGTGQRFGFEGEYSVRLGRFGLPDILLEGSLTAQKTQIDDPLTGEARRIRNIRPLRYRFNYRHDITRWGFSYGGNVVFNGRNRTFELNQIIDERQEIDINAFVETQAIKGITIRLNGWNLADRTEQRNRFIFDPNRLTAAAPLIEARSRRRGRGILLSVEGVY